MQKETSPGHHSATLPLRQVIQQQDTMLLCLWHFRLLHYKLKQNFLQYNSKKKLQTHVMLLHPQDKGPLGYDNVKISTLLVASQSYKQEITKMSIIPQQVVQVLIPGQDVQTHVIADTKTLFQYKESK